MQLHVEHSLIVDVVLLEEVNAESKKKHVKQQNQRSSENWHLELYEIVLEERKKVYFFEHIQQGDEESSEHPCEKTQVDSLFSSELFVFQNFLKLFLSSVLLVDLPHVVSVEFFHYVQNTFQFMAVLQHKRISHQKVELRKKLLV